MRTNEEILKKLSGYRSTPRGRLLLLQKKILSKEEYIFYDASFDFADWDKENHPATYGSFDLNWGEIGFLLGFDGSTICRKGNSLIKKGFWKKRKDHKIQVIGFELTEPKLLNKITLREGLVDLSKYLANSQSHSAEQQDSFAETQEDISKGEPVDQAQIPAVLQSAGSKSDLISFKDRFSISLEMENELAEYREEKWGKEALCFCKSGEKFWNCCKPLTEELLNESTPCRSL